MQRVAFAFAHRDAAVADVVGHPVGQDADAVLLALGRSQQLAHLGGDFGRALEAAVVLVDAVEPHRFRLPVGGGAEQQLALHVVVGQCRRLMLEGHDVVTAEGVYGAVALHRRVAADAAEVVVEAEVQPFGSQNIDGVHLVGDGLVAPEGHDVVEMTPHRRYVPAIIPAPSTSLSALRFPLSAQQSIRKSLAEGAYLQFVARIEVSHLYHLLRCAPVDEACWRHVVVYGAFALAYNGVGAVAVVAVHQHLPYLDICREGVVVHFHHAVGAAAVIVQHPHAPMAFHVAESGFFHEYRGGIVEREGVAALVFAVA